MASGGAEERRRQREEVMALVEESGKMSVVLEILRLAQQRGDRVVIFSRHLHALDLLDLFLSRGAASCQGPGLADTTHWMKGVHWFR